MSARITISTFTETDPDTGVETNGVIAVDDLGEVIVAEVS